MEVAKRPPPTSFSHATSLKIEINPQLKLKLLTVNFKGAFSGLRQFLATERSLKMVKNAFYFT